MLRIAIALCLMTATTLAGPWTVVTSDFRQSTGTLERVDASGIALRQRSGVQELPWRDVLLLRQENVAAPAEPEPFVLHLRNGQRLAGRPAAIDADNILWRSGLGEMKLALESIHGWAKAGEDLPATTNEDLLVLANGDTLRGIVDAGEDGLAVDHGTGVATVKWDAIRSVTLAEIGDVKPASGGLIIKLANGSAMRAKELVSKGAQLLITDSSGQQLPMTFEAVAHIENRAGDTSLLAWQTPEQVSYTPYLAFSDATGPAITMQDELAIGQLVFVNVMRVRPHTILRYTAPADGELHLQYAAAQPGPLTDMTITVRMGENTVVEKTGVNAASPAEPARASVKAGEIVTIDVGYGANFDAGDEMLLLNAAFTKR